MPDFNGRSLYNPSVGPDTGEGFARGILTAGAAIAGGIQERRQTKRQDSMRAEERQWQLDDREASWNREESTYKRRRGDAKSDRESERAYSEGQEISESAGMLAALEHFLPESPELKGAGEWVKQAKDKKDMVGRMKSAISFGSHLVKKKFEADAEMSDSVASTGMMPVPGPDGETMAHLPTVTTKGGKVKMAGSAYPVGKPQGAPQSFILPIEGTDQGRAFYTDGSGEPKPLPGDDIYQFMPPSGPPGNQVSKPGWRKVEPAPKPQVAPTVKSFPMGPEGEMVAMQWDTATQKWVPPAVQGTRAAAKRTLADSALD
jgi:hypothetical protein